MVVYRVTRLTDWDRPASQLEAVGKGNKDQKLREAVKTILRSPYADISHLDLPEREPVTAPVTVPTPIKESKPVKVRKLKARKPDKIEAIKKSAVTVKGTQTISPRAAEARFTKRHVATGRAKLRNPARDRLTTAARVAPAVARTEADLKLQQQWFRHPNRLDFEGVDTNPNKPARTRSPKLQTRRL